MYFPGSYLCSSHCNRIWWSKTLKNPERPSSRMVVKSFTWKGTPTAPFAPTLTTSRTPESSLRWWWKSSHEFWVYPSFGCLGALLEKFIWSKRSNFIRTSTKSKNFIRTVKWTLRPEAWGRIFLQKFGYGFLWCMRLLSSIRIQPIFMSKSSTSVLSLLWIKMPQISSDQAS